MPRDCGLLDPLRCGFAHLARPRLGWVDIESVSVGQHRLGPNSGVRAREIGRQLLLELLGKTRRADAVRGHGFG